MKISLIILFLFFIQAGYAQVPTVLLSDKQVKKVEKAATMKEKLKLYRKYFRKDSVKLARNISKFWQLKSDSIYCSLHETDKKLQKRMSKLSGKVGKLKLPDDFVSQANQSLANVTNGKLNIQDKLNTSGLNVRQLAPVSKVTDAVTEGNARSSGSSQEIQKSVQTEVMTRVGAQPELTELNEVQTQLQKANNTKSPLGYEENPLKGVDSTYLKEQAEKQAREKLMQYLNENPAIMKNLQNKAQLLMKKYSVVPNSNDLSTAVKRTSLKGKMFRERLVIATNFQTPVLDPFTIDLAPALGYRFTSRFTAGVGFTYRVVFTNDSVPGFSEKAFGYKAFTSYDVVNNFFFYSEYACNTSGLIKSEDKSVRNWEQAWQAGIGRRFAVHPKVDMTLILTYNLLHKKGDTIYPTPWAVKVGFQTSQLAMLKRRPSY